LRKRLAASEQDLSRLRAEREDRAAKAKLASVDTELTVRGTKNSQRGPRSWERTVTWGELFATIAPELLEHPNDAGVRLAIARLIGPGGTVDEEILQTIKIQLSALGLVDVQYLKTTKGGMALFWSLTPTGRQEMYARRTVKAD
jgi:hypothetical protein